MDNIEVSVNALIEAKGIINDLCEQNGKITVDCITLIESNMADFDDKMQREMKKYIEIINRFNIEVKKISEENEKGINSRISSIYKYNTNMYKK